MPPQWVWPLGYSGSAGTFPRQRNWSLNPWPGTMKAPLRNSPYEVISTAVTKPSPEAAAQPACEEGVRHRHRLVPGVGHHRLPVGEGGSAVTGVPCLEDPLLWPPPWSPPRLPGQTLRPAPTNCHRRGGAAGRTGSRENRGERPHGLGLQHLRRGWTPPDLSPTRPTGHSLWSRPALCWELQTGKGRPKGRRGRPAPTWVSGSGSPWPWLIQAVSLVALAA